MNGDLDLNVSTLEDENDGDFSAGDLSLREAIAVANEQEGADTITFDESLSGGTITLPQNQSGGRPGVLLNRDLEITDSLTISGLGAENLTIDGASGGGGIFRLETDSRDIDLDVTISGLTLANGTRDRLFFMGSTVGGAIVADANTNLNLQDSVIRGSSANRGGAIYSSGNVSIANSLIENNTSSPADSRDDGVIFTSGELNLSDSSVVNNSGGISGTDIINVSNSTIHGNSGSFGAGILNGGTTTVSNSTITGNTIGIFDSRGYIAGDDIAVNITSSIIAGNGDNQDFLGGGNSSVALTSGGNNLIGNGDNTTGLIDSDIIGTADNPLDPQLGELQDNGGKTPTQALLAGSPALDAGSNPNNLTTDQRGAGFGRTVGNATDIGAYEVQDPSTEPDIIQGTSGDDLLLGTPENDIIDGLDGSDTLVGNTGDDRLSVTGDRNILLGSEGNDSLSGLGAGSDILIGGEGDDVIFTESGNSTLIGGVGDDSLSSNGGNNIILGNEGDDILISSAGGNILIGGAGSDRFNLFIADAEERDIDLIRDFHPGQDSILLNTSTGIGDAFYDSHTGDLFLDRLQVARLETGLNLHPDDIIVG